MSRTPTPQQQAVIDAVKDPSVRILQVRAGAGSGKTSTLCMSAAAYEVPSLYLAFNRVTATDAAEKFPRHVDCKTTHSVAYRTFGLDLKDKLSRPKTGGYVNVAGTGAEIARYYKVVSFSDGEATVSANHMGLLVRQTVARFESSADDSLALHHVPRQDLEDKFPESPSNVAYCRNEILKYSQALWKDRINPKSPILATHDTYLKLYQLSKPVIGSYDVLYVDESQDSTPCVLDVVMRQRDRMKIVMVGDARQAIYGWRGAINAMEEIKDCSTVSLTKSFRFGQAVADVATDVLERDMVLTGFEKINSVVGLNDIVDRTKPHTRLFRSNVALLYSAVTSIMKGEEIAIEIDTGDFRKMLESAYALYQGREKDVKHESIMPYIDWREIAEDGVNNDPDIRRIVKVVNDGLAPEWLELLETFKNSRKPLITFTTAHKSKGREWEQVIVESDFATCYDEDGKWIGLKTEEQNLLYVANTRAVSRLEYNVTTQQLIDRAKRTFNAVKSINKAGFEDT